MEILVDIAFGIVDISKFSLICVFLLLHKIKNPPFWASLTPGIPLDVATCTI